jgi:acetyltransferase-like isoleucine patch superfamily enzyme
MVDNSDYMKTNEDELMKYFGYKGVFGRIQLKIRFSKSWLFHALAYSSPMSNWVVKCQRKRGVKIGENCHISPYVLIDLVYPELIKLEDNVTVGSNSMIFAHVNPTTNEFLKKHGYPRTVKSVVIKKGAIVSVGCIIIAGVTIGENTIIGAGSVVTSDIPDNCIAIGNPARVVKKVE